VLERPSLSLRPLGHLLVAYIAEHGDVLAAAAAGAAGVPLDCAGIMLLHAAIIDNQVASRESWLCITDPTGPLWLPANSWCTPSTALGGVTTPFTAVRGVTTALGGVTTPFTAVRGVTTALGGVTTPFTAVRGVTTALGGVTHPTTTLGGVPTLGHALNST
jgi:hypothetical protein